jgi:CRP-like cAMP-binding protein
MYLAQEEGVFSQTTTLADNLLVGHLPDVSIEKLTALATINEAKVATTLVESEQPAPVYFPLDGVISLTRRLEDGSMIEVGMIGPEGAFAMNTVLGVPVSPHDGVAQSRGLYAVIDAKLFREVMMRDPAILDVMLRYAHSFFTQISQRAACNRVHVVEQRLAHWLLMLRDRVGSDEMSLTQEFLSWMLGSGRPAINVAVGHLKEIGAIEHRRNRVRLLNRQLLEEASCECYRQMFGDYERAMGFPPVAKGRHTDVD